MGITILFVTHDQIEALSLSNRIVVMNRGRIEQIGLPQDLYDHPQTPFVRDFVGKTILVLGKIIEHTRENEVRVALERAHSTHFGVKALIFDRTLLAKQSMWQSALRLLSLGRKTKDKLKPIETIGLRARSKLCFLWGTVTNAESS